MEGIGPCVVLSQQWESTCRLQAEDVLIIKFVVTFLGSTPSSWCHCALTTESGNGVNGTKHSFAELFE